jgi:translation elongation factor EF-4
LKISIAGIRKRGRGRVGKNAFHALRSTQPETPPVPDGSMAQCGFHIFPKKRNRLRGEYDMDIIATSPSVVYEVVTTRGERLFMDNPAQLPEASLMEEIREPIVKAYILCPNESIGDILQLILEKRGVMDHTESLDTRRG